MCIVLIKLLKNIIEALAQDQPAEEEEEGTEVEEQGAKWNRSWISNLAILNHSILTFCTYISCVSNSCKFFSSIKKLYSIALDSRAF